MRDKIALWALGLIMGLLSATVAYVVASIFPLEVARFQSAEMITASVQPGDLARYRVTYEKMRDCGGDAMVVLHPIDGAGRIIGSQLLGNRAPGVWTVTRSVLIPLDAFTGAHRLQEILSYDCGILGQIVRSPMMPIEIAAP